ncbi:DEAD/DEAH box helicase [Desulforhabdus sp. TSK]|uniref:DEAD/DEAH box helicase n=1 Tax=Desulforhabdus sp. TSK TaxID=2925014 RepID=UPI001FC88572|nr:DEAD/DEAH box helicase [Desulforhabdus sp. TSK]GKT08957.1 hypothetical protein DSTSK_22620 [Desulforhabdus sp. TSK]
MAPNDQEFASPLLQLPNTYRAFYGGFRHLQPLQSQAIAPVLAGRDLVLQSATGSGKTEAVLAPCIEGVIRSGGAESILYIVPTRALAIDLERRLASILTQRLGLPFGIRTGDIKRHGGRPCLMLTTPESLDVLMGSSNRDLQSFLQRVRRVIIDEVHPLVNQYRGKQLVCLLRRLQRRTGRPVQKIALSATISDVKGIMDFFRFQPDAVHLLSPVQREIVPHLIHIKKEDEEITALLNDLHDVYEYRKIILFANSRGKCDRLYSLLAAEGRFAGVTELHYSNLKPRERRGVEDRFRRRSRALVIATSTLELGIDIGDVDAVILFGPPDSVSAFLQRIGRSNRRESSTHFWGICRGERAGAELLRFLGLLRLARRGTVEKPLPNRFPSVMVQQVLSCLYEKKRISLPALHDLFPEWGEPLDILFESMEKQGWLRREPPIHRNAPESASASTPPLEAKHACLFHGGWRYRNALLDRSIWSNFPKAEEDYLLELGGDAVADLPHSIVRQLEPGDRVHLAGKRIQIAQIVDEGERKRVLAQPADRLDDKEILWLGAGFQVSFEVAQSIRTLLNDSEERTDTAAVGLFARARRLLDEELARNDRKVLLANGIEVARDPRGLYRYHTFLGSLGNLILRHTLDRDLGMLQDFYVTSDEVGVTCSHWIDFKRLSLPGSQKDYEDWVRDHLRALLALIPLNSFSEALPTLLLVQELTDFLFDPRVADAFNRYLTHPSEIVSGDPAFLNLPQGEELVRQPVILQTSLSPPLLVREKERWAVHGSRPPWALSPEARHHPRPLTGTIVSEYMRHEQCQRRLSFHFLPPDLQPPRRVRADTDLESLRTERGLRHEAHVLDHLRRHGARLTAIEETSGSGSPRKLGARFEETRERLDLLCRTMPCEAPTYVVHGVVIAPGLLRYFFHEELGGSLEGPSGPERTFDSLLEQIDGIGIPDLIRASATPSGLVLEVGDIKDSPQPHYSQKWQVAFYALLLEIALFSGQSSLSPTRVSHSGFLLTRPSESLEGAEMHRFPLAPYRAAMPALLHNVAGILRKTPDKASWLLQEHCTACPYFEACYRQALREQDIQFIPRMGYGTLEKMRQLGLNSIEETGRWFEKGIS